MAQDLKPYRDRITGLETALRDMRDKKEIFNKSQGLKESTEKIRGEAVQIREDIATEKNNREALVNKKNAAVKTVLQAVTKKMDDVLPRGKAILKIDDDGGLFIGWQGEKKAVPYSGLSGGEKVSFDQALVRALGGTILIVEAAEMDPARLTEALDRYAKTGLQVIVSSCHEPDGYPQGWKAVRL
jgi:hypothetical protein